MTDSLTYGLAAAAALTASVVSGTAGFGGAILLLPALTALFGIEKSLPLLALAQLVGNAARAAFGFGQIHWRAVWIFSLGSAPLALVATGLLVVMPLSWARQATAGIVLLVTLLEIAVVFSLLPGVLDRFKPPAFAGAWLSGAGAVVGFISGLAGSTGPLPNAIFLRLQLMPAAYVATDAAAMGILHATKLAAFGLDANWRLPEWQLCSLIAAAMILGTWIGRRVLGRVEEVRYRRVVAIWMLIVALSMFIVPTD
ncbi:MAG: sulfite exporter TauE/SafE family protein [Spirochaetota bacterium]